MMLFFKGITRELHGYPTLRSTELTAGKRQQLLLQCCISPGTDEQEHCIRFAMLFFLCWQHHNCVPGSPQGLLGAASAAQKNNIKVTFFFFCLFYLLKNSLFVLKELGAKGPGRIANRSLLPPTSHHSVCTVLKIGTKTILEVARTRSDITMPAKIFPHRLK